MQTIRQKKIDELLKAILTIKDLEEARNFFRDLLTEKELLEFGNRWQAAKMLEQKIPYTEIQKETGLSSRTIARVAKWLFAGKGGYQNLIKKNNKNHHYNFFPRGKELSWWIYFFS